jgi:hypothetical protein
MGSLNALEFATVATNAYELGAGIGMAVILPALVFLTFQDYRRAGRHVMGRPQGWKKEGGLASPPSLVSAVIRRRCIPGRGDGHSCQAANSDS